MIKFAKPITVDPFGTSTDSEGCVTTDYTGVRHTIMVNVQPKTKNLVYSPIGEIIGATLICFTELNSNIKEKDGVLIESTTAPDYYVSAVNVYRMHKTFELTKIGV